MKLIKTESNNYLYDSYSNAIVMVEDIDFIKINQPEYQDELRDFFVQKKIFSKKYEPKFVTFTEENMRERLNSKLNHLTFNLTDQCNLRCKYCSFSGIYDTRRTHADTKLSEEVAFNALDFFFKRTKETTEKINIGFYGGEPLLNFPLMKKIVHRTIKKYYNPNIKFSFTTNGMLLNKPEIIDFIIKYNIRVSVSLDGPEHIHDKWRTTREDKGTFKTVLKNLSKIKNKNKEYYLDKISFECTLVPPYDILTVNNFFRSHPLTKKNSLTFNMVNTVHMSKEIFQRDDNEIIKNFKKSREFMIESFVKNKPEEAEGIISTWLRSLVRIHRREKINESMYLSLNGICLPGVQRLFVNSSGKFYMCEKVDYCFPIGSVQKGFSYKKIAKLLNTYKRVVEEKCKDCWARYFCSQCYFSIAGKGRMSLAYKDTYCDITRKRTEINLRTYLTIREKNPELLDEFINNTDG